MSETPRRRLKATGLTGLIFTASMLLLVVTACGSATDLADQAGPQSTPSTSATSPTPSPSASATPAVQAPKAGECRSLDNYSLVTRVVTSASEPIKCRTKHNAQTYAVKKMPTKVRRAAEAGESKQVLRAARGFCSRKLGDWLKADRGTVEQSQFGFAVGVPTSSEISQGADWVRCDLYLRNGLTNLVDLPNNTKGALKGPKSTRFHSCVKGDISNARSTVVCSKKHTWRSVSSIRLGKPAKNWPGNKKLRNEAKERCAEDVRKYLNTSGSFNYGYIVPTKRVWNNGERYGVCFAKTRD